ncbi:capping complex subunit for YIEGIA [Anaerosalibacter massiliensis]|uniref:Uncharacterized protein n=1 Tax=Anaerosalibacter massiliensis TaxID=1347392 RepID=A0A9X2MEC1_9FIRM|nr:hypothetical protein [Anaerosalibacter massiliensis]MCR2042543.1 hypothetical protein [Anaerosalibacter massiliensis]
MDIKIKNNILAIVTTDESKIIGGDAPVFLAKDEKERENIAILLSKITLGMIHELENGCYVIVRH